MRFYAASKAARIAVTILWALILAVWLSIAVGGPPRRPYIIWIWALAAALNVCNVWMNYWTVEADALVQHSLLWTKRYDAENLRYAGPVRRPAMRRWLRRAIELQVAGFADVRYATVVERQRFLEMLHDVAPRAEVVI